MSTIVAPLPSSALPALAVSPAVGFKDWSLVCTALQSGRQSLILRKGGIAEGRQGFRFKHEAFFLFPTQYHQQAERVRPEALDDLHPDPGPLQGQVAIRAFFTLDWAVWLDDWEAVARLQPFHVWREDVIRERFSYGDQLGLQCAFGRVYRLAPAWSFADRPAYGGCRSWVHLPEFPAGTIAMQPVLSEADHLALSSEVRGVLG